MLYEGANGIQALDLVGRKLPKDGGRALQAFFAEVTGYIKEHGGDAGMAAFVTPLSQALGELQQATMWFLQNAVGNPDNAGAGATDYMHLFGLVVLGYMWCLIAEAAKAKTEAKANGGDGAAGRMAERLTTGRFFMERMLPGAATHLARIKAGAASTMELPAEAF
jgi:hypothetical protein